VKPVAFFGIWRAVTSVGQTSFYRIFEFEPHSLITLARIAGSVHPDDRSAMEEMIGDSSIAVGVAAWAAASFFQVQDARVGMQGRVHHAVRPGVASHMAGAAALIQVFVAAKATNSEPECGCEISPGLMKLFPPQRIAQHYQKHGARRGDHRQRQPSTPPAQRRHR